MNNPLDPKTISKFVNQLVIPPVLFPRTVWNPTTGEIISNNYIITMTEFKQQILPEDFPKTTVWAYGGAIVDPSNCKNIIRFRNAPGATIEATRGIPVNIQWINNITSSHSLPVDPTLHWADPNNLGMVMPDSVPPFPPGLPKAQAPVPVVPHLHGGENHSIFDGHPDAWRTKTQPYLFLQIFN